MVENPHNLGPRGLAFYASVVGSGTPGAAQVALVVEAARMADTLEDLNDILQGKGVVNLMHLRHMNPSDDTEVTMTVDAVLGERRQLQLSFDRMCKTLSVSAVEPASEGDVGDDLAAQRQARIERASG